MPALPPINGSTKPSSLLASSSSFSAMPHSPPAMLLLSGSCLASSAVGAAPSAGQGGAPRDGAGAAGGGGGCSGGGGVAGGGGMAAHGAMGGSHLGMMALGRGQGPPKKPQISMSADTGLLARRGGRGGGICCSCTLHQIETLAYSHFKTTLRTVVDQRIHFH